MVEWQIKAVGGESDGMHGESKKDAGKPSGLDSSSVYRSEIKF